MRRVGTITDPACCEKQRRLASPPPKGRVIRDTETTPSGLLPLGGGVSEQSELVGGKAQEPPIPLVALLLTDFPHTGGRIGDTGPTPRYEPSALSRNLTPVWGVFFLEVQEVLQELLALGRHDALGVELNSEDRK